MSPIKCATTPLADEGRRNCAASPGRAIVWRNAETDKLLPDVSARFTLKQFDHLQEVAFDISQEGDLDPMIGPRIGWLDDDCA